MNRAFVVFIALGCVTGAIASPPDNFDQRVESLRNSLGTPGVSVAIVENGQVVLAKGYGIRKLGQPEKVGPDTIFRTGSTGKAFTVAALATLVDQGKIKWDDKVIDHMPDFRMFDSWVTREMTIRDLLVHRSGLGLGAGDLLFVPRSDLSRKETVKRLRYIKPATSFRSGYAYDNILYMAAGELIEEVTGQTWEDYIRQRIFKPAGMVHSTADTKTFWPLGTGLIRTRGLMVLCVGRAISSRSMKRRTAQRIRRLPVAWPSARMTWHAGF